MRVWKFIVADDEQVFDSLGVKIFPAVAYVSAPTEGLALQAALAYCKREGLIRARDWEWLFHCRIECIEPTDIRVISFFAL